MERPERTGPVVEARRLVGVSLALLAVVALVAACASDDASGEATPCANARWPDPPTGSTSMRYVAAGCTTALPDGSRERPFPTTTAALEGAPEGVTVLIAAGEYAESIDIQVDGVSLVGAVATDGTPDVILQPPPDEPGVSSDHVADLALRNIEVRSATIAGVWVSGGSASLTGIHVVGTRTSADHPFAHGVLVEQGATVEIESCRVEGSEMVGIFLHQSSGRLVDNHVLDNGEGGVLLQQCASTPVLLDGNRLEDNRVVGIAVSSSTAVLRGNNVLRTASVVHDGEVAGGTGDGIAVVELRDSDGVSLGPASLRMESGNVVEGSARVGLLFDGQTSGTVAGGTFRGNGRAGVWAQAGAGTTAAGPIVIESSILEDNVFVGLGVMGDAEAVARGNAITRTLAGEVFDGLSLEEVGDGIGVFSGARGIVEDNEIADCARAGVIADAPDQDSTVSGNTVQRNPYAIVLQNLTAATGEISDETNVLEDNGHGNAVQRLESSADYLSLSEAARTGFHVPVTERSGQVPGSDPGGG